MADVLPFQAGNMKITRRRFALDTATAAIAVCFTPNLLTGCQTTANSAETLAKADVMDEALVMMSKLAPLSNHGPMAAEALVELERANKVINFVEAYKQRFSAIYPAQRQQITRNNWREALGDGNRVADWTDFFYRELKENDWKQVLENWTNILAPGLAAAAAHGLLRTAHAARSLSVKESDLRLRELAEGLGYWAAYYQPLPEAKNAKPENMTLAQAVNRIPVLPTEKRTRNGSIMVALQNLNDFPAFDNVADFIGTTGKPEQFLSDLTETFAAVYVKNVSPQNFIALIHAVTGTACLRSLLPHLSPATTQKILRYGWQTAAGLYSISGTGKTNNPPEPKEIKRDNLIDRAADSLEEHAIKFTEACLREHSLNPKPIYLQAAQDALERLPRF